MPDHSHGDVAHDHDNATPGHTHDADARRAGVVETGPPAGGLAARVLLTLLGAGGMIVGAFLSWFRIPQIPEAVGGLVGTNTRFSVFYSTALPFPSSFVRSAGFAVIVLGLLAVLGFAFRVGWLTILSGVLAIVAFVLAVVTLYRVEDGGLGINNVGIGLWLVLVGGLLALVGGFFASRARVVPRA